MPNLSSDPQNPSDLLGQPIAVGDIVAWGTTYGRSAAICVAEIVKIRFIRKSGEWNSYNGNKEVDQAQADAYTLQLRPIKSTGSVTWLDNATGKELYDWRPDFNPAQAVAKIKSVRHVKNIVKLDPACLT